MNIRTWKFKAGLSLLAIAGPLALSGFAQAVKAPAAAVKEETLTLEKFNVTGSLLTPPDFEAALPINVYSGAQIQLTTAESVSSYLKFIPTSYGAGNNDEAFVNGGGGRAFIGLRGLPTLTLVNGRRTTTGDLNTVPLGAVDHIDILKDGNGATYGADAVGGVINIVTKKNFNGAQFDVSYQNTDKNDISRKRAEFVYGFSNDKGSLVFGAAYFKQNDLFSKDRDSVTNTNDRSVGATSATPNPGRFNLTAAQNLALFGVNAAAGVRVKDAVKVAASPADFRVGNYAGAAGSPSDRFPYALYTPTVRPAQRNNVFGSVEYKLLGDAVKIYSDLTYMRSYSQAGLAPSPAGFAGTANQATDARIPANYYWNQKVFGAKAVDITSWSYRFVDFGPRNNDTIFDDFATTVGLKGKINERYSYDMSWFWNLNNQLDIERNGVNTARLREILQGRNADFTGARSFNPFTNPFDTGVVSQDPGMLEYIKLEPRTTRDYTTVIRNMTFNGRPFDLPAGAFEGAVGYEQRVEDFARTPDLAKQQAAGSGWNSTTAFASNYSVESLFAEGVAPLIANAPFTKKLQLGGAIRQEKFSHLKKKATIGRVYVRDQINNELTVRASYSEGYTAPTVLNLVEEPSQNFPQIFMPWLGYADQPNQGTIESGNPNLGPTRSESVNLGFVWAPKAIKGFSVTVDYYKVKQKNIIVRDAQIYVDAFAAGGGITKLANGNFAKNNNAPFANRIDVDLDGSRTGIKGYIVQIAPVPYENIAQLEADGLDLEAAYVQRTSTLGSFTYRLNMTRVLGYDIVKGPGQPKTRYAGTFTPNDGVGPQTVPNYRGTLQTDWDYKKMAATIKLNYTSSYKEDPDGGTDFTGRVAAWPTVDATFGYTFDKLGKTTVRVGIENALDRMPPKAESSFADKYDRSMHNILGRMYTIKMTQRF